MTDKKGLLPIVNEEVGFSVQNEVLNAKGNKYIIDILQRLADEDNPCVASYVSQMAIKADTPHERESILYTALGVYRLLESQAEADKMTRELS